MMLTFLYYALDLLDLMEKYETIGTMTILSIEYDHEPTAEETFRISDWLDKKDCHIENGWLIPGKLINDHVFFRQPDRKHESYIKDTDFFFCFTTKEMNNPENLYNSDRFTIGMSWLSDVIANLMDEYNLVLDHTDERVILEMQKEFEEEEMFFNSLDDEENDDL